MRPPDHWHVQARGHGLLWWALPLAAALFLGVLALVLRSPGGDARLIGARAGCPGAAPCLNVDEPGVPPFRVPPPAITGRAAVVVEASCGRLLYGRNAHERLPPASLTKIATALVAVEHADLSEIVDVRVNSALLVASTASTVMGLEPGVRLSVRDLLYGLLLPSGNDAAIAIADAVAGSETSFVQMMNDRAGTLGLFDTHFTNPHGLDEEGLYTSAYDMAMLGRAALDEPDIATIVRTKNYQPAWDGPQVWNGNELLDRYPGAIGIKIGYTEKAGQTILAAAERDGRRLIVSVLGASDRYADASALFDWAFANTDRAC